MILGSIPAGGGNSFNFKGGSTAHSAFHRPCPEVIKINTCSIQLSMKILQLINVKMRTVVDILSFMGAKNSITDLSELEKS